MKRKKIRIQDIAERAGVSGAAVSYALNQAGAVGSDKYAEILRIAKELGYRHNIEKWQKILYLSPVPEEFIRYYQNAAYMNTVEGMRREAEEDGFALTLETIVISDLESRLYSLNSAEYDGVILHGYFLNRDMIQKLQACTKPLLIVDPHEDIYQYDTVSMDNTNGVLELADCMAAYGHRRIGVLSPDNLDNEDFRIRYRSFCRGLRNNGIVLRRDYDFRIRTDYKNFEEDISPAFKSLMERNIPLPTAVFCVNDQMALWVMNACRKLNIEMSVAGYDNFFREETGRSLATIDPHFEAMGRIAVRQLIDRIHDTLRNPLEIKVNSEVILRESLRKLR